MTGALLEGPASLCTDAAGGASGSAARLGGRITLEELLNAALQAVRTNGISECPVCRARMTATGANAGAADAVCGGCGSRLS